MEVTKETMFRLSQIPLPGEQRRILTAIYPDLDDISYNRISSPALANSLGMNYQHVWRALKGLVNAGWLDAEYHSGRTTCYRASYKLCHELGIDVKLKEVERQWDCSVAKFVPMATDVKYFLNDIVTVYEKHGMSLAHEDTEGAFIVEKYNTQNINWLFHALKRL